VAKSPKATASPCSVVVFTGGAQRRFQVVAEYDIIPCRAFRTALDWQRESFWKALGSFETRERPLDARGVLPMRTKGQLEAEISEALVKFEREYMGRGPEETKTYLIDDMILVRLRGVLTPAEKQLARAGDSVRGRDLIKQVRIELLEKGRTLLERIVVDITGQAVKSLHTDISTITGERIIVFVLDRAPSFPKDKPESAAE